jgi:fatty acid desaturase
MSAREHPDAAEYARYVRERLDPTRLAPQPHRLLYGVCHVLVVVGIVVASVSTHSLVLKLLLGVLLGHGVAVISFLGHEILHGSVVRGKRLVLILGGLAMAPWGMLPSVWIKWHNQMHHQNTNAPYDDPDCWPTELAYRHSAAARALERISPGSRNIVSVTHPAVFFTIRVLITIFGYPTFFRTRRSSLLARAYFVSTQGAWLLAAWHAGGPMGILCLFVVPLATANCILISYISTNHALNELTEETNDCLANSLTVTVPRWVAWLHLNFNYHVEHHVLPSVSPRFAPEIHALLLQQWPDRLHEMPHWKALIALYRTPRFYRDAHTLVNPRTGYTARTL